MLKTKSAAKSDMTRPPAQASQIHRMASATKINPPARVGIQPSTTGTILDDAGPGGLASGPAGVATTVKPTIRR
jgi:hypothetical protein